MSIPFSRRDFLQAAAAIIGSTYPEVRGFATAVNSSASPTVRELKGRGKLFPADLEAFEWSQFQAAGYPVPVTGIVYRQMLASWSQFGAGSGIRPASGVPMGGIDTGAFGYSSIFNHYTPQGGPLNTPYLGLGIGDKVWVLTSRRTKNYAGDCRPSLGPPMTFFETPGLAEINGVDYWGHYPIADTQFQTDAPVSVGVRSWAPFIPGDSKTSNTPGAIFEVHLANSTSEKQTGTLAFSFPGFGAHRSRDEIVGWTDLSTTPVLSAPHVERRNAPEGLNGTWVEDKAWGMSYVLAALDETGVRVGGAMGVDGSKWTKIVTGLPPAVQETGDDGGSSVAIDFGLAPHSEKVVRIVLAWYAPVWEGNGNPGTGGKVIYTRDLANYHDGQVDPKGGPGSTGKSYTHMYASRFADAGAVATFLARHHAPLLKRIIAWQSEIYSEKNLPGFLADMLVNAFYYFGPCSIWAQAKPPIGDWCKPEDGLFALSEAPRSCAHMNTFQNAAIGGPFLSMFFPDLALSTLRAFRAAQNEEGNLPCVLGLWMDVAFPLGYEYQKVMNPGNYLGLLHWQWKSSGGEDFLREFYPSAKRLMEYSISLRKDMGLEQILAMPPGGGAEWFEDRTMYGYEAFAGSYRLMGAELMREWAKANGDEDYARKMDATIHAGKEALEKYLWRGDHYLVYNDPTTGKTFDAFYTPQLDGQYFAHVSGAPRVLPKENVEKILTVLREKVCKISKFGIPPNYSNPDGSMWTGSSNPYMAGKYVYTNHQVFWLATLSIYEGHKEFALDLLQKQLHQYCCRWGYMWDGVNCCSGYGDDGEISYGWDYWFNWSIWMVAAALAGGDFTVLLKPGGLADRVKKAGAGSETPSPHQPFTL
jgi:uncharacterized protein (DUF608 family)